MQWVFLIGDSTLSPKRFKDMTFSGSRKVSFTDEQLEVRYDEGYVIFCKEDNADEMKNNFEPDEFAEYMKRIPFEDPRWIMLRYKDIGALKKVIGDERFPEDIIIDCDGADLGLEEVIDKDRLICTKMSNDIIMDKIIAINDWWDGPLLGLATYNGAVCIFEHLFDEKLDEYGDEYLLTPINEEDEKKIMKECQTWCDAAESGKLDDYYEKHREDDPLADALKRSDPATKLRKKARFGLERNECLSNEKKRFIGVAELSILLIKDKIKYYVEWYDKK